MMYTASYVKQLNYDLASLKIFRIAPLHCYHSVLEKLMESEMHLVESRSGTSCHHRSVIATCLASSKVNIVKKKLKIAKKKR